MILYHYYKPGEGILCCMEDDLKMVRFNPDCNSETDPGYIIRVVDEPEFIVQDIVRMEIGDDGTPSTGQIVDEDDYHWVTDI